jgi:hypothetical protein
MSGKSLPTELSPVHSFAYRLFSIFNFKRLKVWLWWLGIFLLICAGIFAEIQTSALQSWFFTSTNERLYYKVENGRSEEIIFPRSGPFDERRGYSKLPSFQTKLEAQGYRVTQQARQSETMLTLLERGVSPPYPERPDTGLEIAGADGATLFHYKNRRHPAAAGENPAVSRKPRSGSAGHALAKPGDRMGSDLQSRFLLHWRQAVAAGAAARRQHPGRPVRKIPPLAQRPHRQPGGETPPSHWRKPQGLS